MEGLQVGDYVVCHTSLMSQKYLDEISSIEGIITEINNCPTRTVIRTQDNKHVPLSNYPFDTKGVLLSIEKKISI